MQREHLNFLKLRLHALCGATLIGLLLVGCGSDESAPEERTARISNYEQVVPFASPPAGVTTQASNNNLDVVEHEGRFYLAFRTAPNHFASKQTELYVLSSDDQEDWVFETKLAMGRDLREPRFLSHRGKLRMYFAVLGDEPTNFEPQETRMIEYRGPQDWSESQVVYIPGFILWRSRVLNERAFLTGYTGESDGPTLLGGTFQVHFLETEDGLNVKPAFGHSEVVYEGGSTESDFTLLDDGSLVAVMRNDMGDEQGWGSKICRSQPGAMSELSCVNDPRKYDSPLVFREGSDVYLVARRNLTKTGYFDQGREDLTFDEQTAKYMVDYSFQPKRCSLWKVDPDAMEVHFLLDLPSKGDTCFAAVTRAGPHQYMLYNYTSPLDDPEYEPTWLIGQGAPTLIYRVLLSLP